VSSRHDAVSGEEYHNRESCAEDEPREAAGEGLAVNSSLLPETMDALNLQLGLEGLGTFAATPQPSPLPAAPLAHQLRSAASKKSRKSSVPSGSHISSAAPGKAPAARGFKAG
jgi:hypothetical protein